MAELSCPVCSNTRLKEQFVASNGYPIVQCEDCGLAFTDDRAAPPPSQLYPPFEQTSSVGQSAFRSALSVFLRHRARLVKHFRSSGRLMDYGCGAGQFAKHMAGEGFEVVGLEPFSLGAPETSAGGQLTLRREPLATAKKDLGTFDVITMWHVLEHIPNPVEVLNELKELLNPGGVLLISVPNFESWQSKVFEGSWFHLDPPRHLLHFTRSTLDGTLGRAGFSAVKEFRFIPEYGSSGWLQSALNRVLPHANYLYELAKDRGALKDFGPKDHLVHLGASAVLGAPILAASIPVEAAASLLGKPAALTVGYQR